MSIYIKESTSAPEGKILQELKGLVDICYPVPLNFVSMEGTKYLYLLEEDSAIGYCAIDENYNYVEDLVVHPDKCRYSLMLIKKLLELIKGEWKAEFRESTSYKYLKLMEKRGKVKIIQENEPTVTSGEKFYRVKFVPLFY